jgi:hypothetical protein
MGMAQFLAHKQHQGGDAGNGVSDDFL